MNLFIGANAADELRCFFGFCASVGKQVGRTQQCLRIGETDLGAELVDIGFRIGNVFAIHNQLPLLNGFQLVDGSDQGGFSGTGGSAHDHHLSLLDLKVDIVQDVQVFEPFVNSVKLDHEQLPFVRSIFRI